MNIQNHTSLDLSDSIANAVKLLSPEQRQQVFNFVSFLSEQQKISIEQNSSFSKQRRVFGQYQGRISMSEDFDEPLPDSFWLGDS
ncbi:MAG: DUF2281 domain-containing protein [Chamaesiphon sp.]|nr:DUF2281 domain-containing protein [Chamaesiphon sp.]